MVPEPSVLVALVQLVDRLPLPPVPPPAVGGARRSTRIGCS